MKEPTASMAHNPLGFLLCLVVDQPPKFGKILELEIFAFQKTQHDRFCGTFKEAGDNVAQHLP